MLVKSLAAFAYPKTVVSTFCIDLLALHLHTMLRGLRTTSYHELNIVITFEFTGYGCAGSVVEPHGILARLVHSVCLQHTQNNNSFLLT
jgi:hypothetical protein